MLEQAQKRADDRIGLFPCRGAPRGVTAHDDDAAAT
jgi:hypothetical protein